MSTFAASNGVIVHRLERGLGFENAAPQVIDQNPGGLSPWGINDRKVEALREFFRAEEDSRLGRWRWLENPEWIVKHIGDHQVIVVNEERFWDNVGKQGQFNQFHYRDARDHGAELSEKAAAYKRAAWAFFEAHPELCPKPWHEAEAGEVWVLTVTEWDGRTAAFHVQRHRDPSRLMFEAIDPDYPVSCLGIQAPIITAAERIYPKDAS